jgi:hypothetical protein
MVPPRAAQSCIQAISGRRYHPFFLGSHKRASAWTPADVTPEGAIGVATPEQGGRGWSAKGPLGARTRGGTPLSKPILERGSMMYPLGTLASG